MIPKPSGFRAGSRAGQCFHRSHRFPRALIGTETTYGSNLTLNLTKTNPNPNPYPKINPQLSSFKVEPKRRHYSVKFEEIGRSKSNYTVLHPSYDGCKVIRTLFLSQPYLKTAWILHQARKWKFWTGTKTWMFSHHVTRVVTWCEGKLTWPPLKY